MCGIVGVAGSIGAKSKKAFNDLLVFDMIRGKDSVGVLMAGRGKQENIVLKDTVMPWELLLKPEYEKYQQRNNIVLLGHNRWKTKGAVDAKNAHPFIHSHIIGVHNGTLKSCYQLPDHTKFDVDSDNLYYALSKESIDDLYPKLNGALSLVWWDEERKRLCFIRNEERPMHMCFSKDNKQMYWASEAPMLAAALKLNGVERKQIISTDEHELVEFEIPKAGKKFTLPTCRTLKPFKPNTYRSNNQYVGNNNVGGYNNVASQADLDAIVARRKARNALSDMEGDWVEFCLVDYVQYDTGSVTVKGITDDGVDVKFWLSDKDFKEFTYDVDSRYGGLVKSVYTCATLDTDTIAILDYDDKDDEADEGTTGGAAGDIITRADFFNNYKHCCWCKKELVFEEENTYITKDTALCEECSSKQAIVNSLKHLIQ